MRQGHRAPRKSRGTGATGTRPRPNASPASVPGGPDGNVWFTESGIGVDGTGNQIDRITPMQT